MDDDKLLQESDLTSGQPRRVPHHVTQYISFNKRRLASE